MAKAKAKADDAIDQARRRAFTPSPPAGNNPKPIQPIDFDSLIRGQNKPLAELRVMYRYYPEAAAVLDAMAIEAEDLENIDF
jgi:hypothetical protein